jgi:tryptophanyl-tRNA synthetase
MFGAAEAARGELRVKPRVFSGIQPSGDLTIGNYLGAIRHWVRDQDAFDSIFCVVDLHAITVPQDPEALCRQTWEVAAILLAAGIDPRRSLLFVQSHVPEHATLCWLLNSVTPIGWLNRMTQFKSKAGSERESVGVGLYDYPVLMAADILAYRTNLVPVGEDQKQHVELTRDIAERFNSIYGESFVVPEPMIPGVGARVMDLLEPTRKMSKSEPHGALRLLDSPDVVRKKLARAVTDSLGVVRFNPEQEGLFNLLKMIESLSGESPGAIEERFRGQGYRAVKEHLGDLVIAALEPLQMRFDEFRQDPSKVDAILAEGAQRAGPMARQMVTATQERLGLRLPLVSVTV